MTKPSLSCRRHFCSFRYSWSGNSIDPYRMTLMVCFKQLHRSLRDDMKNNKEPVCGGRWQESVYCHSSEGWNPKKQHFEQYYILDPCLRGDDRICKQWYSRFFITLRLCFPKPVKECF